MKKEELGALSLLNHSFFHEDSSSAKTRHSEEVNDTTTRSEDPKEKQPSILVRLKRILYGKRDKTSPSSQWLQQYLESRKKADAPEFKIDMPQSNEEQWTDPMRPPNDYDTGETPYMRYQMEQEMHRNAAIEEMRRQQLYWQEMRNQQYYQQEIARQQVYQQIR